MFGTDRSVHLEPLEQSDGLYAEWDRHEDENGGLTKDYRRYIWWKGMFIIICIIVAFVAAGVAIIVGTYNIGFLEAYGLIWDHINGADFSGDPIMAMKDHIVWNLRLPRIIIAVVAGIGLAVAGAVMQSTLMNPMADSYTTGISSGAAFGATLVIAYGAGIFGSDTSLVINAFIFSLVPTFVIVLISTMKKVSATSMILAGIAIMYLFNAMTTVLKLWADPDNLAAVYRWQVGSLYGLAWDDIPIMLLVTVFGSIAVMVLSNKLNILATSDDSARALGINATQLRVSCLVIVSLIAAAIVSYTGVIGFVGLVAPHVVRIFIGSDNRFLIPASAAFGAALLLISDVIGRTIISPSVLEVGVVTAFLGAPLFLYLIIRQKKEVWG